LPERQRQREGTSRGEKKNKKHTEAKEGNKSCPEAWPPTKKGYEALFTAMAHPGTLCCAPHT